MGSKQPERDVGPPMMLTYKEACKKLGISMSRLYQEMRAGKIRKLELGPQERRIPMPELEAWLKAKMAEQFGPGPSSPSDEPAPSLSSSPAGDRERRGEAAA
jgi:excisionase family DNA binding protein